MSDTLIQCFIFPPLDLTVEVTEVRVEPVCLPLLEYAALEHEDWYNGVEY